jgi:hypothetical protein
MARRIHLVADYGGDMLWGADADNVGPIDPDDLPLTPELKKQLREWAERFDRNLSTPAQQEWGFSSEAEKVAFDAEGKRLWAELRSQLGPAYDVSYFSEVSLKSIRVPRAPRKPDA